MFNLKIFNAMKKRLLTKKYPAQINSEIKCSNFLANVKQLKIRSSPCSFFTI